MTDWYSDRNPPRTLTLFDREDGARGFYQSGKHVNLIEPWITEVGFEREILAKLFQRIVFNRWQSVDRAEHGDRRLAEKRGRVEQHEFIHQALVESRRIDLGAAFEQHVGDLHLCQPYQCVLQRNARAVMRDLLQANAARFECLLR